MENSVVIALGSNLGDKFSNLKNAVKELRKFCDIKEVSSIYKSAALLPENAPEEWDIDFYNCVLFCKTNLAPEGLLLETQNIENLLSEGKRAKEKGSWSPRIIDIDIIDFNNDIYGNEELTIPHLQMHKRDFVLLPLRQIYPDYYHKKLGKNINEMVRKLSDIKLEKTNLELEI